MLPILIGERVLKRNYKVKPCQSSLWLHLTQELKMRSNSALAKWFRYADNHSPSQNKGLHNSKAVWNHFSSNLGSPKVRETDEIRGRVNNTEKQMSKTWRALQPAFTPLYWENKSAKNKIHTMISHHWQGKDMNSVHTQTPHTLHIPTPNAHATHTHPYLGCISWTKSITFLNENEGKAQNTIKERIFRNIYFRNWR